MIEKSRARKWQDPRATDTQGTPSSPAVVENAEKDPLLLDDSESEISGNSNFARESQADYDTPHTNDSDLPGLGFPQPRKSWFIRTFPVMVILLRSPRILAAVYGCFTHTMLVSSFDAVLALFVKRTFLWSSTGAGPIFLAITIPSTLGALIGALSDRCSTRAVALFGFALTFISLALLGVVTKGSIADQAALIVLIVASGKFAIAINSLL